MSDAEDSPFDIRTDPDYIPAVENKLAAFRVKYAEQYAQQLSVVNPAFDRPVSDAEDRVRAAANLTKFTAGWPYMHVAYVDEQMVAEIKTVLAELAARPSLSVLRDVAMQHARWIFTPDSWVCRGCGVDLATKWIDQPTMDGAQAAHQLAMMEAATGG